MLYLTLCVVMGVDYQVRVWGGSVCGDGCGLPGEGVERVCGDGCGLSGEGVGRCAGESGWSGM